MPDSNDLQLQKLFIYDPVYSRTVADVYLGKVSEPTRLFQKLICIIDFPRKTAEDGSLIDTIIRAAVKAFEDSRQLTPELILESTLEALNMLLPTIAPKKNPRWLADLNILIGISDRGQVHFSQLGTVQAFLAQGTSLLLVSEDAGALNPLKLFSHITSGLLNPGDALLMTTPSLGDYVADDKIKYLMLHYPPNAAVQELENLIAQAPTSVTFAAVLIKFTTEMDALATRGLAERSMPKPTMRSAAAAEHYDEVLTGSDIDDDALVPRRFARRGRSRAARFSWKSLLRTFLRHAWAYLRLLGRIVRTGFTGIIRVVQAMLFSDARTRHENAVIVYTEKKISNLREHLRSLSKRNRFLVMLLLLLCFVLLHVLLIKGQTRELAVRRSTYEDTLYSLTEQKQAVDNAILYGDEAGAEKILLAMLSSLNSITPLNKTQQDQLAQYRADTERDLNKVRHINSIDAPLELPGLQGIPETSATGLTVAPDGSVMLAADTVVYRLQNSALEKRGKLNAPISFIAQSGDVTLALTTSNELMRIRGTDTMPAQLQKNDRLKSIDALTVYSGNIYILDRSAGVLFKHEGSGASFKTGSVWLDDPGLLNKANNVAIDGNVYLTTRDGEIVKLLKGARQEFKYHDFNPRLGSSVSIYTSKDSNLLYLLDPENKRIAILDKQGNIKDQFTSPKFDALKSLAVNTQEDAIYVLNGKTIYLLAIKK